MSCSRVPDLVSIMEPEVEETIQQLNARKFRSDPIAGPHFSKIVSVMSSAYKRHGFIIERAILEQLKLNPAFEAWEDRVFQVTSTADHIVDGVRLSWLFLPEFVLEPVERRPLVVLCCPPQLA